MSVNISDDFSQLYGNSHGLSMLNCENLTSGNCSYIDPNEFYGVTPLDPADEERLQNIIRVVVPIFFGLIFIVGLVGNLLVVIVVAANQQMRSTTNLLILNLAIADLLFTIFCVPFTACDYMSWWPFGDAWCKIVQYMIVVTAYTSVYTLVFMSFDRYLAVVHPFTSISFRTERNAIYSIIITWLVIVILSSPVLMIHGEFRYHHQSETRIVCVFLQNDYDNMIFHVTFFATSYVIPLALICGLYLRMLIRLWSGAVPGGHVSAEGRRGRKRATRMVVVVVAIFAFCWCPIQVILLVKSLKYYETTFTTVLIQILSHLLGYMNSCVNPVLYAFLSDNFRKAFRKVIYTGQSNDRNNAANPTSLKQHNGQEKHTMAEPREPEPQGRLGCGVKFLNSLLCASNEPSAPKKKWGRKCIECLRPTTEDTGPPTEDQAPQRESWGNRVTFFISTLGMSVGLGQVWRFPTLAYGQGGGAFLIMYGILIFLFGNAIFFFEITNGQYTGKNPLRVYDKVPFFIGIGWSMISYSYLFCTYYNHMVAFGIYYIYRAMTPRMPWSYCQEPDGVKDSYICVPYPRHRNPDLDGVICGDQAFTYNLSRLCSEPNYAKEQQTQCCNLLSVPAESCNSTHFNIEELCRPREFASSYFWNHVVNRVYREDDPNYGGLGELNSWMLLCSFISWVFAYFILYKGIKSMGIIMYILVPLPYIILLVMLGVVTPQRGAMYGLAQFFMPDVYSFLDIAKWRIAAEQAFYSIGVAMGPLITFGSYTKFNSPSHVDGVLICLCIFLTSVLCSSVVFSVLGMLSKKTGRPFNSVVEVGPGLVFIVYPESLELLPGAQFFSSLFYFMLINLGLSSVTGIIETASSAIFDIWPKTRTYKYLVNLVVFSSAFVVGMPITLRGGLTVYNAFDTFSAGIPLVPICVFEMAIIVFIYGLGRFCEDLNFMLGFYPSRFYRYQWMTGPFILLAICIYGCVTLVPPNRLWSQLLGIGLFLAVMGWIPVGMIYTTVVYLKAKKTFKDMFRPPPDHGPRNLADREARDAFSVRRRIF